MGSVRAAMFLDFDNLFGGMLKLDPEVAVRFASDPGTWLGRLSDSLTVEGPRRWLVLRCYMNPNGSVPDPDVASSRLYFSKYRPFFVRAGFEVVDCPPLTYSKNAADIRMVVDAIDALGAGTAYDEFVIASGDSDMTPLLMRLRRADRRTTLMSTSEAADALTAVADRVVDSTAFLALVQGEQPDLNGEADDTDDADPPGVRAVADDAEVSAAFARFRDLVEERYNAASGPLNLATLGHELRRQVGKLIDDSDWFGYGGLGRSLRKLELPGARFSQHYLWDETRHHPPAPDRFDMDLPEPVVRLAALLGLPRLPRQSWVPLYQALADYAGSHRFNLTECTRWCRDRLVGQGVDVSRNAVAYVTRGISFAGYPLHRQPPPTSEEIAAAFIQNVIHRADSHAVGLTDSEEEEVRTWLGGRPSRSCPTDAAECS